MTAAFRLEVLSAGHAREGFACGVEALDQYFARQATQDVRRRASACYVVVEASSDKVAGYYTLAAGGVPLTDLPEALTKQLPRYPCVPVARVGRLAVDRAFHGQKLGGALLAEEWFLRHEGRLAFVDLHVAAIQSVRARCNILLGRKLQRRPEIEPIW